MATSFEEIGLKENLINGLKKNGITEATEIQFKSIPFAMENRDIIGESETGSGKTLAYLLPLFEKVDYSKKEMQAVILAPTHELVMQINNEIKNLAENSELPVTSAALIGNVNLKRQIERLREKPHIIAGSPGRILELIKMKKISAHTIKTIVIDEGDKLLDENNLVLVKDVIKTTMRDRQLMVFSATINEKTINTAKDLMKDPCIIRIQPDIKVNNHITHLYIKAEQRDKIEVLRKLIASVNPERAIIFINKSEEIQLTTAKLQYHHLKASGIYGTALKEERKKALEQFRIGKINLLVASDLAARGLDIKDVHLIINLDLPEDPKEYIHRTGRTGRSGNAGTAISIITERELTTIKKYKQLFNIEIEEKKMYKGALVSPRSFKAPHSVNKSRGK